MLNAVQVALIAALLLWYGIRFRRLRSKGVEVPLARLACALTGGAVIVAAVLLLNGPGRRLLYWHTTERLLIGELASVLIAFALTKPMLRAASGRRASGRRALPPPLRTLQPRIAGVQPWIVGVLQQPRIAVPLWALNFVVWQLPRPFDAAMRHDWLQLISNVLLVALSVNMWIALLDRLRASPQRSRLGDVPYLLSGRLVGIGLGCVAIWSSDVFYPFYLQGETVSSTSPLADQGIAGAVMLAEMALTAVVLLLWLRAQISQGVAPAEAGAALARHPSFAEQSPSAPQPSTTAATSAFAPAADA
jgi:cytochrome c oxidase assembly factor CtaG